MKFTVEVKDGEVYIDGEFVSQLCWTPDAIGQAIAWWLAKDEEE